MKNTKTISILVFLIAILAVFAAIAGILPGEGVEYEFRSIRDQVVTIYGKGLYKHMSSDVAIQGIAQDYITLFLAVPFMIFSLFKTRKDSLKGRFMLAGVLNYIFLTYLFYMNMAMFNAMFLVYVALAGLTFFAFLLTLLSFDMAEIKSTFNIKLPVKFIGGFLIFNAVSVGLMWLGVVVPPLLDNSIYPASVEHYTTLNVQAFDLSLFLPISFIGGVLLIKRKNFGFLIAPVYLVFLSFLMTALVAKIVAMAMAGVNVVPAIIIIPCIAITSIVCCVITLRNIIAK